MAFGDKALDYIERKKAGMIALMQNLAGHTEVEMKARAPWMDRTGNARNGLHSGVEIRKGNEYVLFLSHGVDYGVFLELAHGGNYAVVRPTADSCKNRLRRVVRQYWRET